jgi:hypothetical protein
MAHFAKIDENNLVQQVIVVSNEDCGNYEFPESEIIGQTFINSIGLAGNWKQTSYNNNFRKNYAGIGYSFDESRNAFIPIKVYASWILNEDNCQWKPPVEIPNDNKSYVWNEETINWIEIVETPID